MGNKELPEEWIGRVRDAINRESFLLVTYSEKDKFQCVCDCASAEKFVEMLDFLWAQEHIRPQMHRALANHLRRIAGKSDIDIGPRREDTDINKLNFN